MTDLRTVKRIESWAFLAIADLAVTVSPRLTVVVPDHLCKLLTTHRRATRRTCRLDDLGVSIGQ